MREVYSKYVCCPHSLDRNLCLLQKFVSFKSTASFHVESCHFARSATYYIRSPGFFSPLLPFLQFFLENTSSFPSLFRSFLRNSLFPFNLYFFSPSFVPCLYKCLFFSTMTSFTTFSQVALFPYSFLIVIFISAIIIPILSQSSRLALIAI